MSRRQWAWSPEMLALREKGLKRCSRCKAVKPATAEHFPRKADAYDGLAAHCRQCGKKRGQGGDSPTEWPEEAIGENQPPTQLRFA